MNLSNINSNLPLDATQNNDTSFFSTPLSPQNSPSPINTKFQPTLDNEIPDEMLKQVEYKPSQDITQEKTQSLSLQEEQRMQKIQQKELLINLQKTSKITGTSYSRNMDEAAVLNAPKKDIDNQSIKTITNQRIQVNDALEDEIYIDTAAEKFLNSQNKKNNNDPESSLKDFEEQKRKKDDEENHKKKRNIFDFEDDEIVDLDRGKVTDKHLTINIERHPNINKLKEIKETNRINPALEKALRKDKQINNTNKLRQKFHK
jgi:hypothetical protein